jgi:hypothetical protein
VGESVTSSGCLQRAGVIKGHPITGHQGPRGGVEAVAYPGIFSGGGGGVSKNSVEDRGKRERGSEGGSPLVRGSTQFAN